MITPFDIEKKEFSKGVRGYNIEEVDEFLDQIIVDLEKLMKENLRLKTEVATLEQENEKYKGSEGEVVKVLEQARSLMGDISASADEKRGTGCRTDGPRSQRPCRAAQGREQDPAEAVYQFPRPL